MNVNLPGYLCVIWAFTGLVWIVVGIRAAIWLRWQMKHCRSIEALPKPNVKRNPADWWKDQGG